MEKNNSWAHLDALLPSTHRGQKIAILGGSFDPPHLSHQLLALSVLSLEPVDAVWIMPCSDHPFQKPLTAFQHRLAMCQIAFSRLNNNVHVVAIENYLPTPNYTTKTLELIHHLRPGIEIYFTIGSDTLEQLDNWHAPEKLQTLCNITVFMREGFPLAPDIEGFKKLRIHEGYILPNIASTTIRQNLKSNDTTRFLSVDQLVAQYITHHQLYHTETQLTSPAPSRITTG